MKNIFQFLFAFMLLGQLTSCDYLNIVPDERAQESDTWKNPDAVRGYLYSCYGYMPNNRSYPGSYWGSDELTAVEKELFTTFKYGTYSPINISYTSNTWGTVWNGIRQCYMFQSALKQVNSVDVDAETINLYNAEANFLIAYFHFLSLRSYGPTMIMRDAIDLNTPISEFPERGTVDEVVDFINAKLDEAIPVLPTTFSGKEYGRATRLTAMALKSRLYLYAASPLFNGNQEMYGNFTSGIDGRNLISPTFSVGKWEKCAEVTLQAIQEVEKAKFHLYSDEEAGVPTDNKPGLPHKAQRRLRYMTIDYATTNPEVIWADTRDDDYYGLQRRSAPRQNSGSNKGDLSCTNCPTLQSVEAFYTKNGLPIDQDKTYDYDNRYAYIIAPENCDGNNYGDPAGKVMRLNTERESRFYAWVGYHNGYFEMSQYEDKDPGKGDPAKRAILLQLLKDDPHGRGNRSNSNFSISGYANKKWLRPDAMGNLIQYPYVLFRLGELYLNYAEALVELDRLSEAKVYLDKIRIRAGIPTVDEAWDQYSTNPGYQNTKEGLREIVRAERMNELYLEGHKFFDIRRWKIAEQHLGMPDRGLNTNATKVEDFIPVDLPLQRNFHKGQYLMPIPQNEVNKVPHVVQNPYYN